MEGIEVWKEALKDAHYEICGSVYKSCYCCEIKHYFKMRLIYFQVISKMEPEKAFKKQFRMNIRAINLNLMKILL